MLYKKRTKNMENTHKNILDQHFCRYENLQVQHLDIFKSDQMPNLEKMTNDRNDRFELLKTALESYVQNAASQQNDNTMNILSEYETRLGVLMKLDEQISDEIKKHKAMLRANLNHMKKGKTAMKGYKNTGSTSPKPCVFSMDR